jgi:hypothetical protein
VSERPAVRIAVLLVILAAVFTVAFALGRLVDPADRGGPSDMPGMVMTS